MEQEQLLLEPLLKDSTIKRRALLPLWIKVFIWLFMITGGISLLGPIAGLLSVSFQVSLYGLESNDPLSPIGLLVSFLFLFKGMVAYGLWTEKDWAVNLGIADAILGITVCCLTMLVLPFVDEEAGFTLNLRLELALLIPYLIKLQNIKAAWKKGKQT